MNAKRPNELPLLGSNQDSSDPESDSAIPPLGVFARNHPESAGFPGERPTESPTVSPTPAPRPEALTGEAIAAEYPFLAALAGRYGTVNGEWKHLIDRLAAVERENAELRARIGRAE